MAPRLVKLLRRDQGKESNQFFPPLPVRTKSLVEINPISPLAADGPFFQRLPSEIRHLILFYAFGGQTVHMDLIPRYRKKRKPRRRGARGQRTSHWRTVSDLRGWALWGGVCDRTTRSRGFYYAGFWLHLDEPTEDMCRRPHASWWKEYFPEAVPKPHNIGALGWLLACRRAYVEGVDVLYGTNRLHIRRTYLCQYLSDWLSPATMHAITSVELIWNIHPFGEPFLGYGYRFPPGAGMDGFQTLLDTLPDTLPNLKYLYLALDGDLVMRDRHHSSLKVAKLLLNMVDVMVARFQRLKECTITLPTFQYHAWKLAVMGSGLNRKREEYAPDKVWRDISEKTLDSCHGVKGYWVRHNLTYIGQRL